MKTLLILSVAVLAAGCSPGWVVLNQNSNKELGGTSYAWVGCHVVTKNPTFIILDEIEGIDIDTELDFEFANYLYKKINNV